MLFRFIPTTLFCLPTRKQQSPPTLQPPLQQLLLALLPLPVPILLRDREIHVLHLFPNLKSCLSPNPTCPSASTVPNLPPGIPKSFTPHPRLPPHTHVAKSRPQTSTSSSDLHVRQQKPLPMETCRLNFP